MANSSNSGMLFKTGLFAAIVGAAWFLFQKFTTKNPNTDENPDKTEQLPVKHEEDPTAITDKEERLTWIPNASSDRLVWHKYFALSYNEDHEQADWVAYELTRDRLNANHAARPNSFRPDPDVKTESATPRDYNGSGYDKGHLCPAMDMAFDEFAIDESFFMSNISPQDKSFNCGVWRELEELTRDWARKYSHLYVVTGPILSVDPIGQIGFSKVSVPKYFYRVLLAQDQAIAFILPNQTSEKPIMEYATTVDKVEKVTGLDFFPAMQKDRQETIEANLDKELWPVDSKRFAARVADWNNVK